MNSLTDEPDMLTTDEVSAHEGKLKLICILVLAVPQWEVLRVKVFKEPWQSLSLDVLVGVYFLPLIDNHGAEKKKTDMTNVGEQAAVELSLDTN